MTKLSLILFLLISFSSLFSQPNSVQPNFSGDNDRNLDELEMMKKIEIANESNTLQELVELINTSKLSFNKSQKITECFAKWLVENSPIYRGKSFNDVLQFRAYLIYSLSFFAKNEKVLKYLNYELTFSDNLNVIGAAIYTARFYDDRSLYSLIRPFAEDNFKNVKVNFTDFEIGLVYNSTIQEEAVATLNTTRELGEVIDVKNTSSCCSSESNLNIKEKLILIKKKNRIAKPLNVDFFDQNNTKCSFSDFIGKPFLITFFYTSCTNQNKCANSIAKLKEFQEKFERKKNKIGIYALTYDPFVDKADVLKKYGEAFNFNFSSTSKFLLPASEGESLSTNIFFNTTVNYGNGIINQHGTQLFIFDKKGKIAFKFENELWRADDLVEIFSKLNAE